MPMGKGKSGGGSGGGGGNSAALSKLTYDEPTDTLIADASLQTKPSTVYLGSAFGMSNGVQAVGFRLADGTEALGLVNRFDRDSGSVSNPKFFSLGAAEILSVNEDESQIMRHPIEVNYTTTGDNLTHDFDIIPASAGRLRAEYWLGTNTSGSPIVDFHYDVTQAEVDSGIPVKVKPNFYVLPGGEDIFVRLSGVDLKGNGTLPYFRSTILPYKEITINGHVEYIEDSFNINVGCDYAADPSVNGGIYIAVPLDFKDRFRVFDLKGTFDATNSCIVDFSEFGQGSVTMDHVNDDVEFHYVGGDGWHLHDRKVNHRQRI